LKSASEWYLRYVELRRMVDRYEAQVASLQRICAEFERFEQLKRDLPQGQWAFKEAGRWTFERGIQLIDTHLSLRQEIEWLLDTNRIPLAANRCRTLIEAILKKRCEKLGVRLEFRIGRSSDQREGAELIDGLVQYLKTNQSLRSPEQKTLFNGVKSDQLLTNIGSHHRRLEATTLSRGDIEVTLQDLDEFEALFVCAKCGKEANKDYTPRSAKLKQCECGTLRI